MILTTNLIFLLGVIATQAYKQWKIYYKTMLFVSFCNFLYNFLCRDHLTWAYHPDLLLNHKTTDLINSFVLLPSITLLYLHFFPAKKNRQIIYYLSWIAGFSALEYLWFLFERISYQHGWNFFWSVGFYFAMFYTIRAHHTNLKIALLFSLAVIIFLLITFKIPFYQE
jgi:hypothetical protein